MSSKTYWEKREAEALKHYLQEEQEYQAQLRAIYQNMLDAAQKEIDAFYGRYADKEQITLAEAKRRVSKLDIAAYQRKAKRYVADKDFGKQANEEMRLYNLTMKVNRLEMLKANIGLELVAGHNEQEQFMAKILRGRTEKELQRQAGILGKTVRNNAKLAETIPNASFHGATFSERIWGNQAQMKADLSKLLQQGLIQGKNPRALSKDLRKYYIGDGKDGGAAYAAERLMRTELARVQTEAQRQSFLANGFEMYTFHVNHGCCAACSDLDGKHFKIKDMMPGKNAPPMHPNCRCSASAYEDDAEYEAWLDFLDKGGTTEVWEARRNDTGTELLRRRIGTQGQQIIDKPTYHKLTKDFTKHGGIIVRGKEAERHLEKQGAYASYFMGGNFAFIRDDATVSDVLEEMYHAEQDRKNMFSEYPDREILVRREIDAQKYLISVAEKYKIPIEETEITQLNLKKYEARLSEILRDKEDR